MKRYTILKQGDPSGAYLLETHEGAIISTIVAEGQTTKIQALAETLNAAQAAKPEA